MLFGSQKIDILIVDDDEIQLRLMETRLGKVDGYKVLTAKCGKEGLELAEKRHPRIMLLDWRMPEMTGPVVLGMMKRDDHLKHIPVIMVTARSMMEDVETAFDLGVKDYIVKPLSLKQLSAKVAAVLSKEEI